MKKECLQSVWWFTTLHAGGKFDDSVYKTSGGLHGVGSSVVNALSEYLEIKVSREGAVHYDRYERGIPTVELEEGLLPMIGKTRKTGTWIHFLPDPEIFEKTRFSGTEVKSRLHETAYLNPGLTILYEDKREGSKEKIEYHEPGRHHRIYPGLEQKSKRPSVIRYILKESLMESQWKVPSSM